MSLKQSLAALEPLDGPLWRDIMGFMMNRNGPDRGLCDPEVQDHVQGTIQRACDKRGWAVIQHAGLGKYGTIIRFHANYEKVNGYGDTQAEAITAAYAAALQELA